MPEGFDRAERLIVLAVSLSGPRDERVCRLTVKSLHRLYCPWDLEVLRGSAVMAEEWVHLAVLSLVSDGAIYQCCSEIVSVIISLTSIREVSFGEMLKGHCVPPHHLIDIHLMIITGQPLVVVNGWEGRSWS